MAIHPSGKVTPSPPRRLVLALSPEGGGGVLFGPRGPTHLTLLGVAAILCSDRREGSQVWLAPTGDDLSPLLAAIESHGWDYVPRTRGTTIIGIEAMPPKTPKAPVDGPSLASTPPKRSAREVRAWRAHVADFLEIPTEIETTEDQAAYVYRRLDELDAYVFGVWGVRWGVSVASTAIDIFRRYLKDSLDLSRSVAIDLRALDAYGGGRIELYRAGDFSAPEIPWSEDPETGEVAVAKDDGPCAWDVSSCYATILATHPIPGGFLGYGSTSVAAREWAEPCTITTAYVKVHDSTLYPALRYRAIDPMSQRQEGGRTKSTAGKTRIYYPTGTLLGTWTSAELCSPGVEVIAIPDHAPFPGAPHPGVLRFYDRGAEFRAFAESVTAERQRAIAQGDEEIADILKLLVNSLVGALASRPRVTSAVRSYEHGARNVAPGAWEIDDFQPSAREVLSAAATVTGIGRAIAARALQRLEMFGAEPLDIHTDGGRALGYRQAVRALEECSPGALLGARVRVDPLRRVEVFGPSQSIATSYDGSERARVGGLSRSLTTDEIRSKTKALRACRELLEHAESARVRLPGTGRSRPYTRSELGD